MKAASKVVQKAPPMVDQREAYWVARREDSTAVRSVYRKVASMAATKVC